MKIEYREGTIDDEKSSKKVSLEEVAPETSTTPKETVEEQVFEARLREIIREEIVHYNNIFMSRFGIDEEGVLHLTKGTKLN